MGLERPHAQRRVIGKVEAPTPLIVPSFSSRGFPRLPDLWEEFRHRLYGVGLVSVLDVAERLIPADVTDTLNLTLFDSGMYEANKQFANFNGCFVPASCTNWTRSRYHATLSGIDRIANTVLVNFDEPGSLEDQIASAAENFSAVPEAAADFLVKPTPGSEIVNVAGLGTHAQALDQFDLIGITAREAGGSLQKRCSSVVMLRNALSDAGLDLPIHVFGAITPSEILAYFFCGADVFDGLNWLRQAFRDHGSIPIEAAAFEDMKWKLPEPELFETERAQNLRTLYRLQQQMSEYSLTGDLESMESEFPVASDAVTVAEVAGAEIRSRRKYL